LLLNDCVQHGIGKSGQPPPSNLNTKLLPAFANTSTLAATMSLAIKKFLIVIIHFIVASSCNAIEKKEIARIDFQSEGDFGHEYSKLFLYHKNGTIEARLETSDQSFRKYHAKLDSEALKHLKVFIAELKKVKTSSYCSTVINCTVITSDETIKRTNIDSTWKAFQNLRNLIFAIPN
jgi:hypothetical protein